MPGETKTVSSFDDALIADCIVLYWDGTKSVVCPNDKKGKTITSIKSCFKSGLFWLIKNCIVVKYAYKYNKNIWKT